MYIYIYISLIVNQCGATYYDIIIDRSQISELAHIIDRSHGAYHH